MPGRHPIRVLSEPRCLFNHHLVHLEGFVRRSLGFEQVGELFGTHGLRAGPLVRFKLNRRISLWPLFARLSFLLIYLRLWSEGPVARLF
jgi:hypothetical protein